METDREGGVLPPLDRPCVGCRGTGTLRESRDDGSEPCPLCGGVGHVLTEAGERVLSLIRRHLRPALDAHPE